MNRTKCLVLFLVPASGFLGTRRQRQAGTMENGGSAPFFGRGSVAGVTSALRAARNDRKVLVPS